MPEIELKLYSTLRERLPTAARGQTTLQLAEGATLADLARQFDLPATAIYSVNDEHETNLGRRLAPGDLVRVFSAVGGG